MKHQKHLAKDVLCSHTGHMSYIKTQFSGAQVSDQEPSINLFSKILENRIIMIWAARN